MNSFNKKTLPSAVREKDRDAFIGEKLSFSSAEAYKLLRTNLMFSLPGEEGCRVFGITSSVPGEGKSTTAINLAYSFALAEKRVLLIEMDMRLPVLHQELAVLKSPGLSNLLVGSIKNSEVLQKSGLHEKMYLLTAGDTPPNPSELLGSSRMKLLLDSLREHFDYIVCDLPPVNVVADALAVSPLLDGMVVVARRDYTDRRALDLAIRQLQFAKAKVLGLVMTFDETHDGGKKKYHYHYRYGRNENYYAAAEEHRREEENSKPKKPAKKQ